MEYQQTLNSKFKSVEGVKVEREYFNCLMAGEFKPFDLNKFFHQKDKKLQEF